MASDTAHLPSWVYDLVTAVEDYEDVHGEHRACFARVLAAVPAQERDRAAAIANYQSAPGRSTEPQAESGGGTGQGEGRAEDVRGAL